MSWSCEFVNTTRRYTTCTNYLVSLPLGPDPLDDLRSATRMCSSGTWRRVALRQQASKHWQRTAAAGDPPPCQPSRQQSRKERSSGKTRELALAPESRGQPIPLGWQRLRMQQLQQDLLLEDWSLQPQLALQLHHRLTMDATPLSPETEGRQQTRLALYQMSWSCEFVNTTRRYTTCTNYLEMTIDAKETIHASTDFM